MEKDQDQEQEVENLHFSPVGSESLHTRLTRAHPLTSAGRSLNRTSRAEQHAFIISSNTK